MSRRSYLLWLPEIVKENARVAIHIHINSTNSKHKTQAEKGIDCSGAIYIYVLAHFPGFARAIRNTININTTTAINSHLVDAND